MRTEVTTSPKNMGRGIESEDKGPVKEDLAARRVWPCQALLQGGLPQG